MFRSIKTKILVSQITLILLVAVMLGLSSYYFMIDSLRKSQETNLQYIVQGQANQLAMFIQSKARTLEDIALGNPVKIFQENYEEKLLIEHFDQYKEQFPILSYVNENGLEELKRISGQRAEEFSDLSQQGFFKEAKSKPGQVHIFFPTPSHWPTNDQADLFLEFAFGVQNFFDEFRGFIVGQVSLREIIKEIQDFRFGKTGFLMLIDDQGRILSHPQKDIILKKLTAEGKPSKEIIFKAQSGKSGVGRAFFLGISDLVTLPLINSHDSSLGSPPTMRMQRPFIANLPYLDCFVAYTPVKGRKWSLMAVLPYQEFIATPNILKNIMLGISLAILILGTIFSLYMAKGITKPLAKLAVVTQEIARGHLYQKVAIKSKDEVGILSASFNSMMADLIKSRDGLVSAKEYTDNIIKSLNDSLMVMNQDMIITLVNQATCQLLDYKEEELIGQSFALVLAKENPATSADIKEMIEDGKRLNYDLMYQTRDGRVVPMLFSGSTIRDKLGKLEGIIGIAKDITERQKAQSELQQAFDKLKKTQEDLLRAERLAVVGETSGRVAHEVLNPITGIISRIEYNIDQWQEFSQVIDHTQEIITDWYDQYRQGSFVEYLNKQNEDGISYGDEDFDLLRNLTGSLESFWQKRNDDLHFVRKQINRVVKIINTLRESVRIKRSVTVVNMAVVIKEALEIMEDSLKKRKIEVLSIVPSDLPKVMADENEMIQIFTNMLRNSIQSLDEKKQPGGMIRITFSVSKSALDILIKDNGMGIPMEAQDFVFDFNFTTKPKDQGTGLGLGISRRFVRQYGGDLVLKESFEGIGTTFLITIPVIKDQQQQTGIDKKGYSKSLIPFLAAASPRPQIPSGKSD